MSYLLSIIIPTKNRQFYCIRAVKQIIDLNIKEIQIVIQDNSDDDSLKKDISALSYEHIVYNYHFGVVSFVDNFSEAVSFATGKYFCMIGDDDGVLPNILEIVRFAMDKEYDAVIPGLNSVYIWPSESSFIKNGEKGYLSLSYIKKYVKDVDCRTGLSQLMKTGGQNYQSADLPRLYHGIVKSDCVQKVKQITGTYFSGLTPDIYMAVSLGFVCKKVCRIGFPITVSGVCPRSGSSDSATGKHTGRLSDAPHFAGITNYKWDKKAPQIYSVESIWAESAMQALHKMESGGVCRYMMNSI